VHEEGAISTTTSLADINKVKDIMIVSPYISIQSSRGPFGYNLFLLKLKIENWKHYNKIIFKCVNSTVGPIFNIFFFLMNSAETVVNSAWPVHYLLKAVAHESKKKKENANVKRSSTWIQTLIYNLSKQNSNYFKKKNTIYSLLIHKIKEFVRIWSPLFFFFFLFLIL